jgi:enoyl-[acyl-carrier-protein] reductase (NADH)
VDGNVRANAIAPGFIETELPRAIAAQEPNPEAAMRTRLAMHAIPHAGQPEEIGEAAAYLASDAASFMTGQCLTLDGVYGAVIAEHACSPPKREQTCPLGTFDRAVLIGRLSRSSRWTH